MMTFLATIREVIGWALLGTGLATFGLSGYLVLSQRMACSGLIVAIIGFVVFRGGLHLIKVAVAARAAAEVRTAAGPVPVRKVARPVVARPTLAEPRAPVLPGPKVAPRTR